MKRILAALVIAAFGCCGSAMAQTGPNWSYGFVPTPAQWQAQWQSKQDYLGAPPLLTTGGTMTGELFTATPTTAAAGLNLPPGTAPTSPNNGDIWTTSSGVYAQVNGSTVGPFASSASNPCTSTPSSLQYDNAGALGCVSGATSNGTALTVANGDLIFSGSSSGSSTLNAPATGGGTVALPAGSTTLAGLGTVQTFSAANTFSSTLNVSGTFEIGGTSVALPISLANGGTAASLTASNGGIVYSTASAFAVLGGTVTAGQCLLSGSTAAPTWGSCSGAATAGWGLVLNSTVFSVSTTAPPSGFAEPINLSLSASAAASALTINVLATDSGSAPASSHPVLVPFRSTTLATGTVTWAAITSAQSIVIPSGATLGTSNSVPFRVWLLEEYNAGSPELVVATCSTTTQTYPCASWETNRVTTATISGSATAAGTPYSAAGVSNDAVRIIGYCDFSSGLATAGSWASSCTTLQVFGPGVKKPGGIVQTVYAQSASTATATISPTSTVNLVSVTMNATCSAALNANATGQIERGSTSIGQSNPCVYLGGGTSSGYESSIGANVLDAPDTTSSTAYTINNGGATSISNEMITVYEIMGKLDREPVNDNINPGLYSRIG